MNGFAPVAPRLIRLAGAAALLCGVLGAPAALAQDDEVDVISQPVVQQIPGSKGMKLNDALGRLARNPQDVDALIGAGRASMEIGDLDAAVGFFQRADRLSPGNAQVKAGLAGAYAQSEDPFSAIPLFAEAEKAGMIDPALLSDRGLAYDLVGDNANAQKYYRSALAAGPSDETLRRLALSQAIAGDRRGMEVTLSPLLQRQDKAAWRARAFGLAILGQADEADSIVRSNLPASLAESMSAYVRYMPRLTAAQQAAAANLGHFPRAADIGRDDPRIAAFQPKRPVLAVLAPPPPPVSAKGGKQAKDKDKGRSADRRADQLAKVDKAPVQVAVAPPAAAAPREFAKAPVTLAVKELPPAPVPAIIAAPPAPARSAPVEVKPAPAAPALVAPAVTAPVIAAPPLVPVPVPAPVPSGPGFASLDAGPSPAPAAPVADPKPAAPPPPAAPPVARPRSLADVFADLTPPSREAEPKAGAVDIRRIGPARPVLAEKTARDAKALLPDECEPEVKPAKGAKGAKAAPPAKGGKTAKGASAKGAAAKACPVDPKLAKAKSPAASQPSRIWVQVATGRGKSALAFDWRKLVKENPEILGKSKAATSAWGQSTRLLAGPYDSTAAANAVVTRLKKAGVGGAFVWTSPAGQVVDPLGGDK